MADQANPKAPQDAGVTVSTAEGQTISVETRAPAQARPASPEQSTLVGLLQFEGEVRRQGTVDELGFFAANETRRILPYGQMFILRHARIGDGFRVIAASSIAVVDRNAPLIQSIEEIITRLNKKDGLAKVQDFETRDYAQADDEALIDYPFSFWHWQPLRDLEGVAFGGLLLARVVPLLESEAIRLDRVSETMGHSWRALTGNKPVKRIGRFTSRQKKAVAFALVVIALLPVRMTALAPVEVVAARPFVISAPYSGVIDKIEISPNAQVRPGQPLVRFENVKQRNELALADDKLEVAKARMERATNAAFGTAEESRDVAILRKEYELAQAEYDYASDMMKKSLITAPKPGMAIYTDRREWEGRAVNVGEAIMQVADPGNVEFRIDLPAKEQMALNTGSPVKVWLDSQPLWAYDAKLSRISYQARPTPEGVLAFALNATPLEGAPRIGSRGTARVHGDWVPLIYSVLKRPISSFRQMIGI